MGGNGPGGGPATGYYGLTELSFGVGGGFGGIGANIGESSPVGQTYGNLFTSLQAGSGGGGAGGTFAGGGGGAVELGAVGAITVSGTIEANGGAGGHDPLLGYQGGGGSGGGLFFHAGTITLDASAIVTADGGGLTGGRGRIDFLTDSGTIDSQTSNLEAGNSTYGDPGVIAYGQLGVVPEPSSLVLACMAGAGMALGVTWNRRRSTRRY